MKNKANLLFNKYLLLDNFNFSSAYQLKANNIVSNLLLGYLTNRAVAISRRSNTYSVIPRIYKPLYYSYRKTISCLDWLIAKGYARQSLGFYYKTAEGIRRAGKVTRIELTDKLLNEIQLPEKEIKFNYKQTTPLILKDKHKNLITYPCTEQTKEILKFLNEYNEFMEINSACLEVKSRKKISSLFSSDYDCTNLSFTLLPNPLNSPLSPLLITIKNLAPKLIFEPKYYRVFNSAKFTEGGRFYSGYQNLKKERRKELKLNGYSTVEIDYKALHPTMLYNLEKLDYQDDPYIQIEDFERKDVKVLMQILLNSTSKNQAISAAIHHSRKQIRRLEEILLKDKRNSRIVRKKIVHLERKIEFTVKAFHLIEEEHKRLSKYFYSGIGIHLQRKDSALAEGIMSHFMERNIPILGIHDSFIVPEHHQVELADTMIYYYQRDFNYQPRLSII